MQNRRCADAAQRLNIIKIYAFRSELLRGCTCLSHNFLSEVVNSLLDAFACLEANELFDGDLGSVSLADLIKILTYSLLAVLSADIDLVEEADFLELFVQSADEHLLDDILRFSLVLGELVVLLDRLSEKDLFLVLFVIIRDISLADILGIPGYQPG